MGNSQLSAVAFGVAVVVLVQVSYVGYRQKQRTVGMQKQIAEIEVRSRASLELLGRDLEQERLDARQLREQLVASENELALVALDLEQASARVLMLERLSDERPALEIRLLAGAGLQSFLVSAHNPGKRPVYIRQTEGLVWIDDEAGGFGRSDQSVMVAPGGDAEFFEFSLLGDEPARVSDGTTAFQAAVCFSFERTLDGVASVWGAQYWFEYNAAAQTTAILRHETWEEAGSDAAGCRLASEL